MNLKEMVNKLIIESGVSGELLETTKNQRAEMRRLVEWTKDAWLDVQMESKRWAFLKVESSMIVPMYSTLLKPPEYAGGEVAEWDLDSFRLADTGKSRKDSKLLRYEHFDYFRDHTNLDPARIGPPQTFSIDWSNEAIWISPASDAVRTLYFDYWRTPQELVEDTDAPLMPSQYHRLIIAHALLKYGLHEAASERILAAEREIKKLTPKLHADQGPGIVMRGLME